MAKQTFNTPMVAALFEIITYCTVPRILTQNRHSSSVFHSHSEAVEAVEAVEAAKCIGQDDE